MKTKVRHQSLEYKSRRGTPDYILDKVRLLFGEIDLDPASEECFNNIVKAKKFYTKEDNGLMLPWDGNIFLNYPGGKEDNISNSTIWLLKALYEIHTNSNCKNILIVFFSIEHLNINQFIFDDIVLCFLSKRIKFLNADTLLEDKNPPHNNAIGLLTKDNQTVLKFKDIFEDLGSIIRLAKI